MQDTTTEIRFHEGRYLTIHARERGSGLSAICCHAKEHPPAELFGQATESRLSTTLSKSKVLPSLANYPTGSDLFDDLRLRPGLVSTV
jgi:hypothetical protein